MNPSDQLTPDPDPDYKTELMLLQERLDAVDLSRRDHEHRPDDSMPVSRVGDLPDAVLRIYVLHDETRRRLTLVGHTIMEEQEEWAIAAYEKTTRDLRDYLLRQMELCESFEDLEDDCGNLNDLLAVEIHKLFPELDVDDGLQLGVIGRTLYVVQGLFHATKFCFVSFGPDYLKALGLENEPPELVE